ncbi:MAG: hypothetical protein FWF92_11160 [Oscillospiraceae bacterium]|nr:hypothetical protein [Oscillospiraceae bacterium]
MEMETETGLQITVTKIPYKFDVSSVRKKIIFVIVLILLCALILTVISSQMTVYVSYNGAIVKLNDMIKYINEYYDNLGHYDGVAIKTELDVYYVDTEKIIIEWENNTDEEFIDGWRWNLFKKQNGEFIPEIRISSSENYYPYMQQYSLSPGKTHKRIYWLEVCTEKLTPGTYKIKTFFYSGEGADLNNTYVVETEFEVSKDKSKCGISALDFLDGESWEFYSNGIYPQSSFWVYKNRETYDTILTDGAYKYEIGKGSGKWGVGNIFEYETGGKIYLVYLYSREENGEHCSYICVLDVSDNAEVKEVYRSEPFVSDYDLFIINESLNLPEGTKYAVEDENGDLILYDNAGFRVFFGEVTESEQGVYMRRYIREIGHLCYKDGNFFFEKGKNYR